MKPEEDRATARGNMHKKFDKDHVWFWRYPRGQTDTTQSMGKKTPKIAFPLGFRQPAGRGPSHTDRQHLINIACVLVNRHTYRRAHCNTLPLLPRAK